MIPTQLVRKLQKTHPYVSDNIEVELYTYPYYHVIVHNLFKPDAYEKMCENFYPYINQEQLPHGNIAGSNTVYKAFIHALTEEEAKAPGYDFFISPEWKEFVSNIFEIEFNNHNSYTIHLHRAPSENGHSHRDANICSVIDDPTKPVNVNSYDAYTDDTKDRQPTDTKIMRRVAALYYYNNPDDITEEDGGGTGIYSSYSGDDFIKQVRPYNNSVFLFEIGPKSYHGYIGANFDRCAMVQWFHSDVPSYIRRFYKGKDLDNIEESRYFERWHVNEEVWDYKSATKKYDAEHTS